MKISQVAITAAVLVASVGVAWGVMTSRVAAAEARLDRVETEQRRADARAERNAWMLYRICEKVGAHPCQMPGAR